MCVCKWIFMKVDWLGKFDVGQGTLSVYFSHSLSLTIFFLYISKINFHLKKQARKSLFPFRFYIATEFLLYTHAYIIIRWDIFTHIWQWRLMTFAWKVKMNEILREWCIRKWARGWYNNPIEFLFMERDRQWESDLTENSLWTLIFRRNLLSFNISSSPFNLHNNKD